jgi:DNA modification methylase
MLTFVRNYLELSRDDLVAQRPEGADEDDVHFTEALVAAILAEYTGPGDTVLDPFAGYGTTLVVAQRMGRSAVGIELLPQRVRIIRECVTDRARVIEGDARRLGEYGVGPVDLCLTSPPYMTAANHPENPLTGYTTLDGSYQTYLAELGEVFATVAGLLNPAGHLVINAANLSTGGIVTPLAWDLAAVVSRHMSFRGEKQW